MGCSVKCCRNEQVFHPLKLGSDGQEVASFAFVKENTAPFTNVYSLGALIGTGGYSEVHLCTHNQSGASRAVKLIKKKIHNLEFGSPDELAKEVEITLLLDHPNINRVYEYFDEPETFFIVMEHCEGGQLYEKIRERGRLSEERAASVMEQLLSAVMYMHSLDVVHRDLKPGNILYLTRDGDEVKVIDFGLATYISPGESLTGTVGTPLFLSPEVLQGKYDEKCDEWSLGVIMYMMLSGTPPFEGNTIDRVLEQTLTLSYNCTKGVWKQISEEAVDLMKQLLCRAENRITAEKALRHPWVRELTVKQEPISSLVADVLSSLKTYHPGARLKGAALTYISTQKLALKDEARLKEVFRLLDRNGDGRISKEELVEGFNKRRPGAIADWEAREIMDQIDNQGRGYINYTQFLKSACQKRVLLSKANLLSTFAALDEDSNGRITTEEVRRKLGLCELDTRLIDQIVAEVDENGDGMIDIREFTKMMEEG